MKTTRVVKILLIIAIIFWIAETSYFGWNMKPICKSEEICDSIVRIIFYFAAIIYISPAISLYSEYLSKQK